MSYKKGPESQSVGEWKAANFLETSSVREASRERLRMNGGGGGEKSRCVQDPKLS